MTQVMSKFQDYLMTWEVYANDSTVNEDRVCHFTFYHVQIAFSSMTASLHGTGWHIPFFKSPFLAHMQQNAFKYMY